jgi:hypothetical protein
MGSPEFGPDFGGFEGETALSQIERSQMLAELARTQQEMAHEHAAAEVAKNPELLAMLGKLIEGGPELSPEATAHLRRMIALSYNFYAYAQQAADAAIDEELHGMVVESLQGELDELDRMAESETLPDLWDIAYEDLLRLEGGNEQG